MKRPLNPLVWLVAVAVVLGAGFYFFWARPGENRSPIEWKFERNEQGRVVKVTNPGGHETAVNVATTAAGSVKEVVLEQEGKQQKLAYDVHGRQVSTTSSETKTTLDYDVHSRLIKVQREAQPAVSFAYDLSGRDAGVELGGVWKITKRYDYLGRPAEVQTQVGRVQYSYESGEKDLPQRSRTLPGGVRTVWTYNVDGSLAAITHSRADGSVLGKFAYSYYPGGHVKEVKQTTPKGKVQLEQFEYDLEHRLVRATGAYGELRYSYDELGNRLLVERKSAEPKPAATYDWAGRLLTNEGRRCTHDAAGNLTHYVSAGIDRQLSYLPAGAIESVQVGEKQLQYAYADDGALQSRSKGLQSTSYIVDPRVDYWRPLQAVDPSGKRICYLWEGSTPLAAAGYGNVEFYLTDQLGSVRYAVDEKGNVVGEFDYEPFGHCAALKITAALPTGSELRPGFAGLFFDPEAGLYLTRARAYDPNLGRFLQPDPEIRVPLGSQQDLVAYVYCGNDPVNFVDFDGKRTRYTAAREWVKGKVKQFETNMAAKAQYWADKSVYGSPLEKIIAVPMGLGYASLTDLEKAEPWLTLPLIEAKGAYAIYEGAKIYNDTLIVANPDSTEAERDEARKDILKSAITTVFKDKFVPEVVRSYPGTRLGKITDFAGGVVERLDTVDTWSEPLSEIADQLFPATPTPSGSTIVYDESVPRGGNPLDPTDVGGVYLAGAGKTLPDLGQLKGLTLDENNRLVLIGEKQGDVRLPPLRLDDVVTVFRCVYLHGEAPSVSIDPDPRKPEAAHKVRHGPGTANTYVGWVLYQADRIMKDYANGLDRCTKRPIVTHVPGYKTKGELALELDPSNDTTWQRYWFVPAQVERRQNDLRTLTIFDVGIKLETVTESIVNNKFIQLPAASQTKSGVAYARWVTKNFEELGEEIVLQPPPESGVTEPVAIFVEMRRIALIAAIAETLYQQDVPLPAWMNEHPVRECLVPLESPTMINTIERKLKNVARTYRTVGGVRLSPEDKAVRTVANDPLAAQLQPAVATAIGTASPLQSVSFAAGGKQYEATALPGLGTQDVGANRRQVTDLAITLGPDRQLSVSRQYHSFMNVRGELGAGWTLDLPELRKTPKVTRREGDKFWTNSIWQLTSPLGSCNEVFSELKDVPAAGLKLMTSTRASDFLGLAGDDEDPRIGFKTQRLLLRNHDTWHFDPQGRFVGCESGPSLTVYRRNADQRLTKLEGWLGKERQGEIAFQFAGNKLSSISAGEQVVRYVYDSEGRLSSVSRGGHTFGYQYRPASALLVTMSKNADKEREFEYDASARLVSEQDGKGHKISYAYTRTAAGIEVTSRSSSGKTEVARYDAAFRPTVRESADGIRTEWQRSPEGGQQVVLRLRDGREMRAAKSADGKTKTLTTPTGAVVKTDLDAAGNPTSIKEGEQTLAKLAYRRDGLLSTLEVDNLKIDPRYSKEGVLESAYFGPTAAEDKRWLQIGYDEQGRVISYKPSRGGDVKIQRTAAGDVRKVEAPAGSLTIEHDSAGRITQADSSWGFRQQNRFAADGVLQAIELNSEGSNGRVVLRDGKPTEITDFDGGKTQLDYYGEGKHQGLLKSVATPGGLILIYQYDKDRRLTQVVCGKRYQLVYQYDDQGRITSLKREPVPAS